MTEDDALRELQALTSDGGWHPLPGPPGAPIFMRPWPDGSVDALAVHGAGEAYGERTNPAGHPVWRLPGNVVEVIAGLRQLPAPDDPDAPPEVLSRESLDRLL